MCTTSENNFVLSVKEQAAKQTMMADLAEYQLPESFFNFLVWLARQDEPQFIAKHHKQKFEKEVGDYAYYDALFHSVLLVEGLRLQVEKSCLLHLSYIPVHGGCGCGCCKRKPIPQEFDIIEKKIDALPQLLKDINYIKQSFDENFESMYSTLKHKSNTY
jgi:hypothetical protein